MIDVRNAGAAVLSGQTPDGLLTDEVVPLSEQLELAEVGPQLAVLLGSVDRGLLSGRDRLQLVRARNRLISHLQAELLADP